MSASIEESQIHVYQKAHPLHNADLIRQRRWHLLRSVFAGCMPSMC